MSTPPVIRYRDHELRVTNAGGDFVVEVARFSVLHDHLGSFPGRTVDDALDAAKSFLDALLRRQPLTEILYAPRPHVITTIGAAIPLAPPPPVSLLDFNYLLPVDDGQGNLFFALATDTIP